MFVLNLTLVTVYTDAHLAVSDLPVLVVGSAGIPWRERTERTSGENISIIFSKESFHLEGASQQLTELVACVVFGRVALETWDRKESRVHL